MPFIEARSAAEFAEEVYVLKPAVVATVRSLLKVMRFIPEVIHELLSPMSIPLRLITIFDFE